MKKEKQSPHDKKVSKLMLKFQEGDFLSSKSDVIVTNPKQTIAIALSEVEGLDKKTKK